MCKIIWECITEEETFELCLDSRRKEREERCPFHVWETEQWGGHQSVQSAFAEQQESKQNRRKFTLEQSTFCLGKDWRSRSTQQCWKMECSSFSSSRPQCLSRACMRSPFLYTLQMLFLSVVLSRVEDGLEFYFLRHLATLRYYNSTYVGHREKWANTA